MEKLRKNFLRFSEGGPCQSFSSCASMDKVEGGKLPMTEEKKEENTVYILLCADGSFYTGWSNHLARRLAAHNAGKGAKYTKMRRPVRLVYQEKLPSRSAALKREYQIKQLSHAQKAALILEQEKGKR